MMTSEVFEFGPFRLSPVSRNLGRGGSAVPLTDREFDTLLAIVQGRGSPVSNETLLAAVWGQDSVNVETNNLAKQIQSLRRKLGPDISGEHYIRNIVGRGYFVAGVRVLKAAAPYIATKPAVLAHVPAPIALLAGTILGLTLLIARSGPPGTRITTYHRLTFDGTIKSGPVLTDGEKVFFMEAESGRDRAVSVPGRGGNVTPLNFPFNRAIALDYSQKRHSLLIRNEVEGRNHLIEWQLETSRARELPIAAGFNATGGAAWHPDGSRIAITDRDQLVVLSAAGAGVLYSIHLPGYALKPTWNPTGDRLRVTIGDAVDGKSCCWEVAETDRVARPIPEFSEIPRALFWGWASDGKRFIFTTPGVEQSDVWIAEDSTAAKTKPQKMTHGSLRWDSAATAPNSQTIYAIGCQWSGETVRLGPTGSGEGAVLLGVPAYELDYSRDGQWVVFTRYPDSTIWRAKSNGAEARQLTSADVEAHQGHWSPDGTRVAFMGKKAAKESAWHIYVVPAMGGAMYEPLPNWGDQGVPTWSADGTSIVFGDRRSPSGFEKASIHQLDLRTTTISSIGAPEGLWSPRISPDGKYLAAVTYDSRSLYVRDNKSAIWKKLIDMDFIEHAAWSPDSSWIQVFVRNGKRPALLRIARDGSRIEKTVDLTGAPIFSESWFGIAPDGSPLGLRGKEACDLYALDWQ
jgi:DNA-binding winged helix-turn-helix (wHTH) protein/Tol biopolymer transport system component